MTINKSYNKVGMPQSYSWNGVQELDYDFELETGNLLSRTDVLKNLSESFTYDDLNRLTASDGNTYTYFDNGNIKTKSDVSNSIYQYDPVKSNALVQLNNTKMAISGLQEQNATYNSAQDLVSLSENGYGLNFRFDANNQRSQSKLTHNNNLVQTKTYLSNMEVIERDGSAQNVHYISGGDGLAAVYVEENGIGNYYFVGTDYLGSILTLADKNGNIVQEQSFGAWGRYRNTEDWSYDNVNPPTLDIDGDFSWLRGYTGHEYLPQFSLIHMNGRLYDPLLGRMLSPDNFVQNSFGTQAFNRYSYVHNNPLKYTDPSGELVGDGILGPYNQKTYSFFDVNQFYENGNKQENSFGPQNLLVNLNDDITKQQGVLKNTPFDNHNGTRGTIEGINNITAQNQSNGNLLPASSYDYSQETIDGKFTEDWNYILNGSSGNPFSRAAAVFSRDWNAASSSDKVGLAASVIPFGIIVRGPALLLKGKSVVNISKFSNKLSKGRGFVDPKTGYRLSRDLGKGNSHGGSYWKLFDKKGNRVGTFDQSGNYLRP